MPNSVAGFQLSPLKYWQLPIPAGWWPSWLKLCWHMHDDFPSCSSKSSLWVSNSTGKYWHWQSPVVILPVLDEPPCSWDSICYKWCTHEAGWRVHDTVTVYVNTVQQFRQHVVYEYVPHSTDISTTKTRMTLYDLSSFLFSRVEGKGATTFHLYKRYIRISHFFSSSLL